MRTSYNLLYARINELIEQEPRVVVAIDGSAASGKTTLARELES